MASNTDGTSYNVVMSVLVKDANTDTVRQLVKFSPTVRDGVRKIDGKDTIVNNFDDALEIALDGAIGRGNWEYLSSDNENWAMVSTPDAGVTIFCAWIRSGSRCPTCAALRTNPRDWCHDANGCEMFRANPKVKGIGKKRRGFARARSRK